MFTGQRKQEQIPQTREESLGSTGSNVHATPDKLNRSFEKIDKNCPLLEVERNEIITREKAFQLGIITSTPVSTKNGSFITAHGNKISSSNNLQESLSRTAVCASWKSQDGKLELFQNDSVRRGLDEELTLICTNCKHTCSFNTSKIAKDGSSRAEVNSRLIQGGLDAGNGLTSLKKLCSSLDLPPPLSKNAYFDTVKKIEKCYSTVVESSLCKAASNLKIRMKER